MVTKLAAQDGRSLSREGTVAFKPFQRHSILGHLEIANWQGTACSSSNMPLGTTTFLLWELGERDENGLRTKRGQESSRGRPRGQVGRACGVASSPNKLTNTTIITNQLTKQVTSLCWLQYASASGKARSVCEVPDELRSFKASRSWWRSFMHRKWEMEEAWVD